MSAPGNQPSSAKAIRVVPYLPPRPSEDSQSSAGSATATATATTTPSGRDRDAGAPFSTDIADGRNNLPSERRSRRELGPPSPLSRENLKRQDGGHGGHGGVSGRGEPATLRSPAAAAAAAEATEARAAGLSPAAIPANYYPPPSRGRVSAASYTTSSSRPSRNSTSRSSHISDTESEAPSSAGTERRPQSRRRNFVAVLNDDKKTFSLVPQRPRPPEDSLAEQAQHDGPRAESALSDYGGGPSFRSSQLHSTPRVSQASSHEGISSYASSQYERPSSSLAGALPDRSATPGTPTSAVPSSPGLTITQDFIPDSSPQSWAQRMVGGLRRVPNLRSASPEKQHSSAHTKTSSSDTLTPLPAVTDSANPGQDQDRDQDQDQDPAPSGSIEEEEEQASTTHSSPNSSASDRTNYRVYRDVSQAAPDVALHPPAEEESEHRSSDERLPDPFLRPQPSFATARTGSTEFENTNYKVYGHTDSEGSDDGHSDSPTAGPSARALRLPHIPLLEPQSSIASLQSVQSETSDSTNYRVYGPASPTLDTVPELRPVQSFLSTVSAISTIPETDNYVVYGRDSPALSVDSFQPPSPSGSYAPLLKTTLAQSQHVPEEGRAPVTANTESNYIVHGDPSPEPSRNASTATSAESGGTVLRHAPGQASAEGRDSFEASVRSPPLRRSQDGFGYFTARSRSRSISKEELRTKKSLKSVKSSISSIITEDATESFFAGQAYLEGPPGEYEASGPSVAGPSERQRQLDDQRERERREKEASAWEGEGAPPGSQGSMALPATPHQWSSQLSTVVSESEPDSTRTHSSLASVSLPGSPNGHGSQSGHGSHGSYGSYGSHERRHSRGWSTHSRQMLSISSSLAAEMEAASRSRSNSGPNSSERPSPTQRYQGQVRHHDEDGDGLADLQVVTPRPSRKRLSDMFNQPNTSERNLHTSASMASFHNGIPTWAKLYYGSGERRHLRGFSGSSMSDFSSRAESMMQHSSSPTSDHFPTGLWSPRRRAQEGHMAPQRSANGSVQNTPHGSADDHVHDLGFRRGLRRMTSSVWSPHLRRDVRANRYTIWDTPSVAWSAESGVFGRRNLQVVLFVTGFVFPFAWMVGALLPLPKPSPLAMVQRDSSYSDLGVRTSSHEFERHIESVDELRYQNAKWWRMLNRCMSVIGLLIIGAVVGLVVAALKQGWGTRT